MKEKLMKAKEEMRAFIRSKTAKYAATASAMVAGLSVAAHAEETGTSVDFSPITTALTSGISVSTVMTLIGTMVGAGIVFVLVWFGARKIISSFQSALKNGKIKI